MSIENYNPNGKGFIGQAGKYKNFNLLFNKFPKFVYNSQKPKDSGFEFYKKAEKTKDKTIPAFFLGETLTRGVCNAFFDPTFIKQIQENYYKQISNLGYQTNLEENILELKPEWRMNVGLGGESVYETGMTLHHIYGFPYIPATAIKGIVRYYLIERDFESNEGKAIQNQEFCDLFGCPSDVKVDKKTHYSFYYQPNKDIGERKGKVIFFDAFPITAPILSPDIMNNHYPKYYDGSGKPPADWQSPIPIFFLTVKETSFKFVVGMKPNNYDATLLKTTIDLLKEALSQKGIGAKTAVGYGYMQNK